MCYGVAVRIGYGQPVRTWRPPVLFRIGGFFMQEREEKILKWGPLVAKIANRIWRRIPHDSLEFDDLCSAGILGLIWAVDRYDPARGDFDSYASSRIRGAILDELREYDYVSRRHGRDILSRNQAIHSIDADDGTMKLVENQPVEGVGLDDQIDAKRIQGILINCKMNPRDRKVLWLYYFQDMKLKTIGILMGVTESRAAERRARGVKYLRKIMGVIQCRGYSGQFRRRFCLG
jgi:RNA polymerase sigma factor for flagellar operon FliA